MISMEALYHFQCTTCGKWWTVGDADLSRQWFCTWCGEQQPMQAVTVKKEEPPVLKLELAIAERKAVAVFKRRVLEVVDMARDGELPVINQKFKDLKTEIRKLDVA